MHFRKKKSLIYLPKACSRALLTRQTAYIVEYFLLLVYATVMSLETALIKSDNYSKSKKEGRVR